MRSFVRVNGGFLFAATLALTLGQGCPSTDTGTGDPNNTNPNTTDNKGLPGDASRVAFQSQCAQNVITCTVEFPKARFTVVPGVGQQVTQTAKGFIVQGTDHSGSEVVNLLSSSTAGVSATQLFYEWSQGATDANRFSLKPGPVFSTQANPSVEFKTGLHYVRLSLRNDTLRDELRAPNGDLVATNVYLYDFLELEIDVRD